MEHIPGYGCDQGARKTEFASAQQTVNRSQRYIVKMQRVPKGQQGVLCGHAVTSDNAQSEDVTKMLVSGCLVHSGKKLKIFRRKGDTNI